MATEARDGSTRQERSTVVAAERRRLGVDRPRTARNKTEPGRARRGGPARGRPAGGRKPTAGRKPAAKTRARTVARKTRRVVKPALTPVRTARTGSITGLIVGSLGMVLLWNFLAAAGEVSGFLGGIAKALNWLASPSAIIEFKES